jgi:hypothetical protein
MKSKSYLRVSSLLILLFAGLGAAADDYATLRVQRQEVFKFTQVPNGCAGW